MIYKVAIVRGGGSVVLRQDDLNTSASYPSSTFSGLEGADALERAASSLVRGAWWLTLVRTGKAPPTPQATASSYAKQLGHAFDGVIEVQLPRHAPLLVALMAMMAPLKNKGVGRVAIALGLPENKLSGWVNGAEPMPWEALTAVADATGHDLYVIPVKRKQRSDTKK